MCYLERNLLYICIYFKDVGIMAKPIKITPVLKGEDAVNFYTSLEKSDKRKVSSDTILTIRKDADRLKSLFKHRK